MSEKILPPEQGREVEMLHREQTAIRLIQQFLGEYVAMMRDREPDAVDRLMFHVDWYQRRLSRLIPNDRELAQLITDTRLPDAHDTPDRAD